RNYVSLYKDHGTSPRGASYAYVLLPGATAVETAAASRQSVGSILRNDAAAQGIKFRNTTAANFWSAATVGNITAAGPASVLAWETPGVLKMAVSDPTQTAENVTLTISGTRFRQVKSATEVTLTRNSNGTLTLVIPTAGLAGQSVELQLNP
ncbi:MAG: polysaccharide lyase beta-sandwich domain-containing protein, partial [Actinomycetota bacterium]|nr:polysaccharide lyase beta-sandwich domain-containing protein [Actinomycetota bacterium]